MSSTTRTGRWPRAVLSRRDRQAIEGRRIAVVDSIVAQPPHMAWQISRQRSIHGPVEQGVSGDVAVARVRLGAVGEAARLVGVLLEGADRVVGCVELGQLVA